MATSSLSPAVLKDWQLTMPPSEITATSDVPPPISTIMFPEHEFMGIPAPMAAKIGSLAKYACFAPAFMAASITALLSVEVIPAGTPIIISGFKNFQKPETLSMKYFSMAWVTRKSAITPSFRGL